MEGKQITLEQILRHRERRAALQKELLERFCCPLITFTMNIAGPIKTNEMIREAFLEGFSTLQKMIRRSGYYIICSRIENSLCGDQGFLCVEGDPAKLKVLAMELEESDEIGRLYDIDVINTDGIKLERDHYRKCLICDRQAQICGRERTHSVQQLQKATQRILDNHFNKNDEHCSSFFIQY